MTIRCVLGSLLGTVFENQIFSRYFEVIWPARSCDLTPLDYFLWGTVRDKCYVNHPETISDLKHEIKEAIHKILTGTIETALEDCVNRMAYCKASRGSHMNDRGM